MQNTNTSPHSPPVDTVPYLQRSRWFLCRVSLLLRSTVWFCFRSHLWGCGRWQQSWEWRLYDRRIRSRWWFWMSFGTWLFLVIGITLLCLSILEEPCAPLRVWILGYLLWGVFHSVCGCWVQKKEKDTICCEVVMGSGGGGEFCSSFFLSSAI